MSYRVRRLALDFDTDFFMTPLQMPESLTETFQEKMEKLYAHHKALEQPMATLDSTTIKKCRVCYREEDKEPDTAKTTVSTVLAGLTNPHGRMVSEWMFV